MDERKFWFLFPFFNSEEKGSLLAEIIGSEMSIEALLSFPLLKDFVLDTFTVVCRREEQITIDPDEPFFFLAYHAVLYLTSCLATEHPWLVYAVANFFAKMFSVNFDRFEKRIPLVSTEREDCGEGWQDDLFDLCVEEQTKVDSLKVISNTFGPIIGTNIGVHRDSFTLPVLFYIKYSANSKRPEYKLTNQLVRGGVVEGISKRQLKYLIREGVRGNVHKKLLAPGIQIDVPLLETVKQIVQEENSYRQTLSRERFGHISTDTPPCVTSLLNSLECGENIGHLARVFLVTYLGRRGMEEDQLVATFGNSPDFNEAITRKQVRHVLGKTGSMTKYAVFSCSKLKTLALCHNDAGCAEEMRSPLSYKRTTSPWLAEEISGQRDDLPFPSFPISQPVKFW